jgi:hypothetical protein
MSPLHAVIFRLSASLKWQGQCHKSFFLFTKFGMKGDMCFKSVADLWLHVIIYIVLHHPKTNYCLYVSVHLTVELGELSLKFEGIRSRFKIQSKWEGGLSKTTYLLAHHWLYNQLLPSSGFSLFTVFHSKDLTLPVNMVGTFHFQQSPDGSSIPEDQAFISAMFSKFVSTKWCCITCLS